MPYPVYIICSEGGALDKASNSVSIFGVIETVRFVKSEKPVRLNDIKGNLLLPIRVTAAWKRDEAESETTFEHEMLMWLPGDELPKRLMEGSFVFKHQRHRFIADLRIGAVDKEGAIRIENRIREFGQDNWITQQYEISVEQVTVTNEPKKDS